jgi:F0F1-type ATP synthase assembly protein I
VPDPGKDRQGEERSTLRSEGARFAGLGLTWTLSVLLFLGAGWWLDGKLGTTPIFTILGSFVGAGGGFYYMYIEVTGRPGSNRGP